MHIHIMIDGIKGRVFGVSPEALRQRLDFYTPVNDNTGEAANYSYARMGNFFLSLTPHRTCLFRGSLHKYAHNGVNSTDFSYSDLIGSVDRLADLFEAPPANIMLHNVEFGVNLDYPPDEITENLLMYGAHPFVPMAAKAGRSLGMKCELSQYGLKVYGKSKTRLRVETQVKRMQFLKGLAGGATLNFESLKDKTTLTKLGEMLLEAWGKVMVWEEVDLDNLSPKVQKLFDLGRHPTFWTELQKSNPNNFKKKKARFLDLQHQYAITNRKTEVATLSGEKWVTLLQS